MELLTLFANQAAIALDLLQRARRAQSVLRGEGQAAVLARLAAKLEERADDGALRFLQVLEELL